MSRPGYRVLASCLKLHDDGASAAAVGHAGYSAAMSFRQFRARCADAFIRDDDSQENIKRKLLTHAKQNYR